MRVVVILVRNNQALEIFTRRRGGLYDGFEVWMVGVFKGRRTVLDHFITHEHLERRLCYARAGDLVWNDTDESKLPPHLTSRAATAEESNREGKFLEQDRVAYYFNALTWIDADRKVLNAVKQTILGRWSDGLATISFSPEHRLCVLCPAGRSHPLFVAAHEHQADWWSFRSWMLVMLNVEKGRGERVGVLRCDATDLHIFSGHSDTLVHVFHRDSTV